MKELSIEEKAKAYDEAIKYAQYLINERCKEDTNGSFHRADLNKMFSELAESEDERIKKNIKIALMSMEDNLAAFYSTHRTSQKELLAWLEKQGKQKPIEWHREDEQNLNVCLGYIPDEFLRRWLMDVVHVKYDKPTDKVETKFNVGDWLQYRNAKPFFVEEITKQGYVNGDSCLPFNWENEIHLWTIQDAKGGDVLYCKSGDIEYIVMSKGINEHGNIDSYFRYNSLNGFGVDIPSVLSARQNNITPATKEQRDLLFAKMKEAGYEWDNEKKELKKIEQIPTWSEEDEMQLDAAIHLVSSTGHIETTNWLKSLKERVQPQQKQEWSESDEEEFHIAIETLAEAGQNDSAHWLQFLKERYTWKPSDEQMEALNAISVTGVISYAEQGQELINLYNVLRRLRGE